METLARLAGCGGNPDLEWRWLSRDPLGERMGPNIYAYVGNNPINEIDPLGLVGFGFQAGGEGALGLGGPLSPSGTSLGGTGSAGAGIFINSQNGVMSEGTFLSGGAFVHSPVGSAAAPNGGAGLCPSNNYAMGASVSTGWSGFLTNANNPGDLNGPFSHFNITILAVSISLDLGSNSQGQTIGILSVGGGAGISSSAYTTTTSTNFK